MEVESYEHEMPSWVDLGIPNPKEAARFYSSFGRIAVVADDQGAAFTVLTHEEGAGS